MAEEAEKRFHDIMDKLFQSPNTKSTLSSSSSVNAQNSRGQKRPYALLESKLKGDKVEGVQNLPGQAPLVRPWDRGDLMRRLATFKSMTWFAKPKVVDAVNCARRGWINVDMDIIACEACGARLLFSTPSSWSKEQVQKAALVFSLKLDNGHKLLCPWIYNACDEKLALFPPTPAPVLFDHYREHFAALLQLSALPVIPASVIEDMRSPQVEYFLKQSTGLECGNAPVGSSWTEYVGDSSEAVSADLYHQAHKLLSLCGWEPRLLPYIVDCSDQTMQSANDVANVSAAEQSTSLTVYHSGSSNMVESDEGPMRPGAYYDPNSTVLECKLCGASVGLWTFTTVPRPLELIRMVGYTETDGRNDLESDKCGTENHSSSVSTVGKEATMSKVMLPNLSLTIAGGPPPTKQSFRAKISLPVIGRNLRARFSLELSERRNAGEEGFTSCNTITKGPTGSTEEAEKGSSQSDRSPGGMEDSGKFNQESGGLDAQVSSTSGLEPDHSDGLRNQELHDGCNLQQTPRNTLVSTENMMDVPSDEHTPLSKTAEASGTTAKHLKRPASERTMEFHPIRQHRHFCPWIASTDTTAPGWKQSLLALQKEKVFSSPDSRDSTLSPSLIKVMQN
ncbi:hypothetical protein Ancab_038733 [Ancistrocladus abbreviatus]